MRLTANLGLFDPLLAGGSSHTTHPSPPAPPTVSALDASLRFELHPLLLRYTPKVRVAVTLLCRASSDNFLTRRSPTPCLSAPAALGSHPHHCIRTIEMWSRRSYLCAVLRPAFPVSSAHCQATMLDPTLPHLTPLSSFLRSALSHPKAVYPRWNTPFFLNAHQSSSLATAIYILQTGLFLLCHNTLDRRAETQWSAIDEEKPAAIAAGCCTNIFTLCQLPALVTD